MNEAAAPARDSNPGRLSGLLAAGAALLLAGCAGTGATPAAPGPEAGRQAAARLSETARLSCWGDETDPEYGSRSARSPVLVSPGGHYRAFAEGEALAFDERPGPEPGCVNASRLYLAKGSGEYEVIFSLAPFRQVTGNSLRVVDWSPDGETLLFEAEMWQYASEFENPDVLLLHARRRYFEALDLGRAVAEAFTPDCFLHWKALGYLPDGGVAVETYSGGLLYEPNCEDRTSRWRLDEEGRLDRLSPETEIERYGTAPPD